MSGDLAWVVELRTEPLTYFFKLFPYLASYYFFLSTFALGYWLSSKNKAFWLDLGFMITFSTMLNRILKETFAIARPSVERLIEINDGSYSFPSGDAQVLTVFWLMLAYHYHKQILWIFAILMILLVSASRVYLGVHFPIDVIVGSLIGILSFLAYVTWFKDNMSALIKRTNPIYQTLSLAALCILYYLILQKSFTKIDIIIVATLVGCWFGYLILPKHLCQTPLKPVSVLVGAFITAALIYALRSLLLSFPGIQELEFTCYFTLAFFFIYLVPVFTYKFRKYFLAS